MSVNLKDRGVWDPSHHNASNSDLLADLVGPDLSFVDQFLLDQVSCHCGGVAMQDDLQPGLPQISDASYASRPGLDPLYQYHLPPSAWDTTRKALPRGLESIEISSGVQWAREPAIDNFLDFPMSGLSPTNCGSTNVEAFLRGASSTQFLPFPWMTSISEGEDLEAINMTQSMSGNAVNTVPPQREMTDDVGASTQPNSVTTEMNYSGPLNSSGRQPRSRSPGSILAIPNSPLPMHAGSISMTQPLGGEAATCALGQAQQCHFLDRQQNRFPADSGLQHYLNHPTTSSDTIQVTLPRHTALSSLDMHRATHAQSEILDVGPHDTVHCPDSSTDHHNPILLDSPPRVPPPSPLDSTDAGTMEGSQASSSTARKRPEPHTALEPNMRNRFKKGSTFLKERLDLEPAILFPSAKEELDGAQRLARASGDLYSPLEKRGNHREREARCEYCQTWHCLRNSRYGDHMLSCHGIRSSTLRKCDNPVKATRTRTFVCREDGSKKLAHTEIAVKCGRCQEYIKLNQSQMKTEYRLAASWWRHANRCHKANGKLDNAKIVA